MLLFQRGAQANGRNYRRSCLLSAKLPRLIFLWGGLLPKSKLSPLQQQRRLQRMKQILKWLMLLIAFSGSLLLLAALFTSPMIKGLQLRSLSSPKPSERLLSLQQAVSICDAHARQQLKQRLSQLSFDQRSSRYVSSINQYHLFFDLQMVDPRYRHRDPYVLCYVHAGDGEVEHYRARNLGSGLLFFQ